MSLSNPTLKNPCKKFIAWKSDSASFVYYDKESEQNTTMPLPIRFVVLDQLNTIKGFCKADESGFVSNEVHRIDQVMNVRSFKGNFKAVGKYQDIKDEVKAAGGKFCKSVYVMLKNTDGTFELANFQFYGASLEPWIEFTKKNDITTIGVEIKDEYLEQKNGGIKFRQPVFGRLKINKEIILSAVAMDKELQNYLKQYEAQKQEETIAKEESVQSSVQSENETFFTETYAKMKNDNYGKSDVSDVTDIPF